ncbi:hypothetical protein BDP27DRAFT_1481909 [Rhodocollybia butyracea]|uniref:Uncharacterized protein n=1 Tax=Rhodocollybia butyracea TaxID=206335 RepID=A0A9P5U1N5_9AGAR|nr:hypothetical protein BDP27DRAFT_1481909 [Rhodocollybia butyracea]
MSERGSGKKGDKPKRGWGVGIGRPSGLSGLSPFRGSHAPSHSISDSLMSNSRPNTRSTSRNTANAAPDVSPAPPNPGPTVPASTPVSGIAENSHSMRGSADNLHSSSEPGVSAQNTELPTSSMKTISPTKQTGPSFPNVVTENSTQDRETHALSSGMGSSPLTELSHTDSPPMADKEFVA